jgi:hypothetical protein
MARCNLREDYPLEQNIHTVRPTLARAILFAGGNREITAKEWNHDRKG